MKTCFGIIVFVFALLINSTAYSLSVKANAKAAHGCLTKVDLAQAQAAIKRYRLGTVNALPEETRALGTALVWIEKLNGDKPLELAVVPPNRSYLVHFTNGKGHSQQLGNGINIRRNGTLHYGQNVAQLSHELGHFVGNNGAYAEYRRATGGKFCNVSTYSMSKPNEQFAEAFASFVTYPELIRNNPSAACQAAYDYFANDLFANGQLAEQCGNPVVSQVTTTGAIH